MDQNERIPVKILDPSKATEITESGELERPKLNQRRIDCGGSLEITDRRDTRGAAHG